MCSAARSSTILTMNASESATYVWVQTTATPIVSKIRVTRR